MNVTFTGGTERERDLVRTALRSLLNFDLDLWDIDVEFKWVADPSARGHNDLAATTTSGQGTALVEIRNDLDRYKNYPPTFYIESIIHEIGHVLTRHLPDDLRTAVAGLFGQDVSVIDDYDDSPPWEDRPYEGIVETFKDAFLPRNMRLFANRTNVKLPIHRYGDFRAIYRQADFEGGEGGDIFDHLREYDTSLWHANQTHGLYEAPSEQIGTVEATKEYQVPVSAGDAFGYVFEVNENPLFDIWAPGIFSQDFTRFRWRFICYFHATATPFVPTNQRIDWTHLLLEITQTPSSTSGEVSFLEGQGDKPFTNGRHTLSPAPIVNPSTGNYDLYVAPAPSQWLPDVPIVEEWVSPISGYMHIGIEFELQGKRPGLTADPDDLLLIQNALPHLFTEGDFTVRPQQTPPTSVIDPQASRSGSVRNKHRVAGGRA